MRLNAEDKRICFEQFQSIKFEFQLFPPASEHVLSKTGLSCRESCLIGSFYSLTLDRSCLIVHSRKVKHCIALYIIVMAAESRVACRKS